MAVNDRMLSFIVVACISDSQGTSMLLRKRQSNFGKGLKNSTKLFFFFFWFMKKGQETFQWVNNIFVGQEIYFVGHVCF